MQGKSTGTCKPRHKVCVGGSWQSSTRLRVRKWGCSASVSPPVPLPIHQQAPGWRWQHTERGKPSPRGCRGFGVHSPDVSQFPGSLQGPCSSRTIPDPYRGQSLAERVSGAPGCGSSVTCQERTQMSLPRPQIPAGYSTRTSLGSPALGRKFSAFSALLENAMFVQLGAARTWGTFQGAAGTPLRALGCRCSATNSNQTPLLQHRHCRGASQTPTATNAPDGPGGLFQS